MADESAIPCSFKPKKARISNKYYIDEQLLAILETSACDEFDEVESVASLGWESSSDGETSVDETQHSDNVDHVTNIATNNNCTKRTDVEWKPDPQHMINFPFLKKRMFAFSS
ncbi:hypothetical protein QE152_g27747 [Popillia japonica]|uniref:PiggyBac transposable element-derived protein domain-containing protein n=1 Tax=Popillia japonica TaxID=7064 RepID=A0AAW1JNK8_POPJA